tara:strand:- start:1775 stop:2104 length:330 start_codon:yes stop_codon:yes gene_type:complete
VPNIRETVRRGVLHQFVQAGIANYDLDIPDLPVNSPRAHYAISEIALEIIKTYKTRKWKNALKAFLHRLAHERKNIVTTGKCPRFGYNSQMVGFYCCLRESIMRFSLLL